MERRREHACVERREPLREERADHTRKHVSRAGFRERRRSLVHHRDGLAIGDETLRPLNKRRHAIRKRDKARELISVVGREPEGGGKPSSLARMGRHDRLEPGLEALLDELAALFRSEEGKSAPVYHEWRADRFDHGEGELLARSARRVEARA